MCWGLQAISIVKVSWLVMLGGAIALVVVFHKYVWDLPVVDEDMLR